MQSILAIAAVLVTGPLLGVEFGVAAFSNPLAANLPDESYRQFRSGGSRQLGALMPFWYVSAFVVLIVCAVVSQTVPAFVAVAAMGAATVLSVVVLVPINNRIGRWSSVEDVNRDLTARWDRLHWVRVALLTALFLAVCLGLGSVG
jgi:hypothetical protein